MWKKRLTQIFIGVVTLFIAYVLYDYFLVPVKVLEDDKIVVAEKTEFGIVADSLVVHKSEVQANDNISSILQKYTIDSRTVDQIVRKSDTIFDFHKFVPVILILYYAATIISKQYNILFTKILRFRILFTICATRFIFTIFSGMWTKI